MYLRQEDGSGVVETSLVFAKNHLCPVSGSLTIPRSEICAVVLGVRVAKQLLGELELEVTGSTFGWTQCPR